MDEGEGIKMLCDERIEKADDFIASFAAQIEELLLQGPCSPATHITLKGIVSEIYGKGFIKGVLRNLPGKECGK